MGIRDIENALQEVAALSATASLSMTVQAALYGRPASAEVMTSDADGAEMRTTGETLVEALDAMREHLEAARGGAHPHRRSTDPTPCACDET